MITTSNYLDFGNFFINEVIGSPILALLLILVLVAYWGVSNKLEFHVLLAVMMFISFLFLGIIYNSLLLIIIALVVAIVFYGAVVKVLSNR